MRYHSAQRRPLPSLTRRIDAICPWALACFVACTQGATSDAGTDALLRIDGAQFVRGPGPEAQSGPSVASIDIPNLTIWPGETRKALHGSLDSSSTAVALALSGDVGYWIAVAKAPDYSTPDLPSFAATGSFSPTLMQGTYLLSVRAVDGAGGFGPPLLQTLTALAAPPSDGMESAFTITLTWDTESDLDLHVIDPPGEEIYHGSKTTLSPYSSPTPSGDAGGYGYLDHDSNANCAIDGRREERALWKGAPPSGRYEVKVDANSLCGEAIAYWDVRASFGGATLAEAAGVATDADTRPSHDRGAGMLALSFQLP